MDPQEYIVGGRRIGALLLWLLLAGEIYTTFTFLGAAGWAYGQGRARVLHPLLRHDRVRHLVLPRAADPPHRARARVPHRPGLLPRPLRQPAARRARRAARLSDARAVRHAAAHGPADSAADRRASARSTRSARSRSASSSSRSSRSSPACAARRGRASRRTSLVLLGVIFAGIRAADRTSSARRPARSTPCCAIIRAGSRSRGRRARTASPGSITTTILTACGFFMWPQSMAAIYSARDEDTLRRNAVFLPFYQVMLLLVFFAGFAALEVLPGLKGPAADQSFMLVVQKYYPAWILGFVAAAGTLAALIPASGQLLAAASIVGKNVFADYGIARDAASQTRTTRILVLVVALLAFGFWAIAKVDAGRPAADRLQRRHAALPGRRAGRGRPPAAGGRGRRGAHRRAHRADRVRDHRTGQSRASTPAWSRSPSTRSCSGSRPGSSRLALPWGHCARSQSPSASVWGCVPSTTASARA